MKMNHAFEAVLTRLNIRRISMRFANLTSAIILGAALVMTLCASSVRAQTIQLPAWYADQLVTLSIVNANVIGVNYPGVTEAANKLYRIGYKDGSGNWVDVQPHVISIGLGAAGYNPYWHVYDIEVPPGDASKFTDPDNQYQSEDDVLQSGYTPVDTGLTLLCQETSLTYP